MFRKSLFTLSLIGLAACSSPKPLPDCGHRPSDDTLSVAEKAALTDALARYGGRCTGGGHQCIISVRQKKDGGITVTVRSVTPDRKSGKCLHPIGHGEIAVYSADGQFIKMLPMI